MPSNEQLIHPVTAWKSVSGQIPSFIVDIPSMIYIKTDLSIRY